MSKFTTGQTVKVVMQHDDDPRPDTVGEEAVIEDVIGGFLYGLKTTAGENGKRGIADLWWYTDDELKLVEVAA